MQGGFEKLLDMLLSAPQNHTPKIDAVTASLSQSAARLPKWEIAEDGHLLVVDAKSPLRSKPPSQGEQTAQTCAMACLQKLRLQKLRSFSA